MCAATTDVPQYLCPYVCLCACVHEEMRTMNGGRSKYLIFVIRMNFSKYKKV